MRSAWMARAGEEQDEVGNSSIFGVRLGRCGRALAGAWTACR